MGRQLRTRDLPIDLLRTLVVSVEAGSIAEAALQLDLPAPAIEGHLGRLRDIIGFELLSKSGPQLRPTKGAATILSFAQRIISMNEELVRAVSKTTAATAEKFRIGMPAWVPHARLIEIIRTCRSAWTDGTVTFRCDERETMIRDLNCGQLDLCFMCNVSRAPGTTIAEWTEPLYWVKGRDLELKAGEPVGLVSSPGSISDRVGTRLLESAGIEYFVTFSSPSAATRLAAVAAGLGLILSNERGVSSDVCVATEAHLPQPSDIKTGIYMRDGLDGGRHFSILRAFERIMAPRVPAMP